MTRLAWHFAPADGKLNYTGEPIPADGVTLTVDPDRLEACSYGLHGSARAIDALNYANRDAIVCRVELGGKIIEHGDPVDKLCASERTILWRLTPERTDAVLREFARWCASQVLHLWDAPQVVRDYLETGDENLRDAARDAAQDARDAAWAAARAAAWDARDAARDAAQDARDAAWAAAQDAAWAAARAAAWDAWAAARAAAWDAARDAQNAKLEELLTAAHEGRS